MSVSAYKRVQREHESPRSTERRIFSRVTAALASLGPAYDRAETRLERLAALHGSLQPALAENIRLWAVLKADLASPDNALPDALKAQIISIALTVERVSAGIMRGEGKVEQLVAINRPFIDALSGVAGDGA